jgi:hypothetical protein
MTYIKYNSNVSKHLRCDIWIDLFSSSPISNSRMSRDVFLHAYKDVSKELFRSLRTSIIESLLVLSAKQPITEYKAWTWHEWLSIKIVDEREVYDSLIQGW